MMLYSVPLRTEGNGDDGESGSHLASCSAVAIQPRPPKHRTKVRHRRDLWVVSCSCGWSETKVSKFSAWMAERSHLGTLGLGHPSGSKSPWERSRASPGE